jgi:hypothetical protein
LARALEVTTRGGRIGILDSGNFGGVQIRRAVSITNDGPGEAILATSDVGGPVRVAAGANDRVYLRGLTLDGSMGGIAGINFATAGAVHVERCTIRNFQAAIPVAFRPGESLPTHGIRFLPTAESELYVSDTSIAGNGNSPVSSNGILIQPASTGSAKVVLNRVQINDNLNGVFIDSSLVTRRPEVLVGPVDFQRIRPPGVQVTVRDSIISGNTGTAVVARSAAFTATTGVTTGVVVDRVAIVSNGVGVVADGARASARIVDSTIVGNGTGLLAVNFGRLNYAKANAIGDNRTNINEPPTNE